MNTGYHALEDQMLVAFLAHQYNTKPPATLLSLLLTNSKLSVSGITELICISLKCLHMSFREWIIWSSPNFSGVGLYRVDCAPSTRFSFYFSSPPLASSFTCCTSTSCTSRGFILAILCGTCQVCGKLVLVNPIFDSAQADKPALLHGCTVLILHSHKRYLIFGLQEPLRFQPIENI